MSHEHGWRRQVGDLIALTRGSDLTAISIEQGGFALHIECDTLSALVAPAVAAPLAAVQVAETVDDANMLRSPQVGTFYLSAEPHGEPFIHLGSTVEEGQVIGLIEAMKLINEVEAESSGVVKRILVEDGQAVEYGQPLFELE